MKIILKVILLIIFMFCQLFAQTDEFLADKTAKSPLFIPLENVPLTSDSKPKIYHPELFKAAGDAYAGTYLGNSFDRTTIVPPLTYTNISSISFVGGADFDAAGNLYVIQWNGIDQLSTMDTTTGVQTIIGPSTPGSGQIWSGLAFDPTTRIWYGCSTDGASSSVFYTIDPSTGAATSIGSTGVANSVAALEIDDTGQMYAFSLVANAIFLVDKSNGSVTQLGPSFTSGVSVAHGLSFHNATGNLYLSTARAGNVSDLFLIDTNNGNATLIGTYPLGFYPAGFAITGVFSSPANPKAPTNFLTYSDHSTPTSILLNWSDPTEYISGNPLTNFTIEVFRDSAFVASVFMGTETYTDGGLTDGQLYNYTIFAKDSVDSMSFGAISSWNAGGAGQPLPPENFRIGITSNGLTAYWINPSKNIDGTPLDDLAGINLYEHGNFLTTFTVASGDTGQNASANFFPSVGAHHFFITAIDNESPVNESDSSNTSYTPLRLPFFDDFAISGQPDPYLWINHYAEVNDLGVNPPSTPYVLSLDGHPHSSLIEADVVTSLPFDLRNLNGVGIELSFWYQPQGTGNEPEPGDSLSVDFLNDQGEWILVRQWPGSAMVPFANEVILLDSENPGTGATFFFAGFQFRFRNYGTPSTVTPFDHWLIDDVSFVLNGAGISVAPTSLAFDSTEVGSSTQLSLLISSIGTDTLKVSNIISTNSAFSVDTINFDIPTGGFLRISVFFTPLQTGNYSGELQIISNAVSGDTLDVAVSGIAVQLINEDMYTITTPELTTAITNEGTIGMLNSNGGSPGFTWLSSNYLYEGALMFGIGTDHVVDGARARVGGSQAQLDADFQFLSNINVIVDNADSTVLETSFDDSRANLPPLADDGPNIPIGLDINQTTYSYTDTANSGYVIYRLEITNTTGSQLNGIVAGAYFDWDIDAVTYEQNTGAVSFENVQIPGINGGNPYNAEFSYIWNANTPLLGYTGAVPLSQNYFLTSRISDQRTEVYGLMTEANKFSYISKRRAVDPYGPGGGGIDDDKGIFFGFGGGTGGTGTVPDTGFTIPAGGTVTVGFALVGGDDMADFVQNGKAAMQKWADLGNDIIVFELVSSIEDEFSGIPAEFALHQNYPNPFNPITTIKYDLKQNTDVLIKVYDLLGREVRTVVDKNQNAGYKKVVWDGTNNSGQKVSTGVYFYKIVAGDFVKTMKMVLMK